MSYDVVIHWGEGYVLFKTPKPMWLVNSVTDQEIIVDSCNTKNVVLQTASLSNDSRLYLIIPINIYCLESVLRNSLQTHLAVCKKLFFQMEYLKQVDTFAIGYISFAMINFSQFILPNTTLHSELNHTCIKEEQLPRCN